MARSLNRVQLIGNLTRDPELRYTPTGSAVCSFSIATNRTWTTDDGQKHEEADFHRVVAWNKLAEICSQFLVKGRKVYVEGRLSTRNWTAQDGQPRSTTEVVIDNMILLDPKRQEGENNLEESQIEKKDEKKQKEPKKEENKSVQKDQDRILDNEKTEGKNESESEEVAPDDIPF
ncbi:MAG: single-stranded DNA-binding protein [Patescibacteria group bacterium]|nr:single-stranded DNA-binding protein [Patescibacteria group bacterium]